MFTSARQHTYRKIKIWRINVSVLTWYCGVGIFPNVQAYATYWIYWKADPFWKLLCEAVSSWKETSFRRHSPVDVIMKRDNTHCVVESPLVEIVYYVRHFIFRLAGGGDHIHRVMPVTNAATDISNMAQQSMHMCRFWQARPTLNREWLNG